MANRAQGPVPLGLDLLTTRHQPSERADASRNRKKILRAASEIVESAGPEALSVSEVARAAGIGVGTIYRRFGDRAGLIMALLDEREYAFQKAFFSGPPPVGPGAAPAERLRAFLHALVDRVEAQRTLLLLVESSSTTTRFRSGPYTVYHTHLVALLRTLRPDANAAFLADALLAVVSATQLNHQRTDRGRSPEEIKAGLDDLLAFASLGADCQRSKES